MTNIIFPVGFHGIPTVPEARFDALTRQNEPTCHENTQNDTLRRIDAWFHQRDGMPVFSLSGLAGTGKSTIARTVAKKYWDDCPAASFFFTQGKRDLESSKYFVTTIATQLASKIPGVKKHIIKVVDRIPDICDLSLAYQWEHLVLKPLSNISIGLKQSRRILIVDALDECDSNDVEKILQLFSGHHALDDAHLRVFITSRSDAIESKIENILTGYCKWFLDKADESVISLFIKDQFDKIRKDYHESPDWPGEEKIHKLCKKADGLFLYASTVCRFIGEHAALVKERLDLILTTNNTTKSLYKIYATVLEESLPKNCHDRTELKHLHKKFHNVVGSLIVLFDELPLLNLAKLIEKEEKDINLALTNLGSVIDIPDRPDRAIKLLHPSFRGFLVDKRSAQFFVDREKGSAQFLVNSGSAHRYLFRKCLQIMETSLRHDLCNFKSPGISSERIEESDIEKGIPIHVQYACQFWAYHFRKSQVRESDYNIIYKFLERTTLLWLEALAVMGYISDGLSMIKLIAKMLPDNTQNGKVTAVRRNKLSEIPQIRALLLDVERYIIDSMPLLNKAPLQTFYSALLFAPKKSLIKKHFWKQRPPCLARDPCAEETWSTPCQVLTEHYGSVTALAFSPNSRWLTSASVDTTVRLWNLKEFTSSEFRGHEDWVSAVTFSPDGQQVVSVSAKGDLQLWNSKKRNVLASVLNESNDRFYDVAFSPDGQKIAGASGDKTVWLWSVENDETGVKLSLHKRLKHARWVKRVAFSPDGALLASVPGDKTVRIWRTKGNKELYSLAGHDLDVTDVVFSKNSQRLASASEDRTVRLWDTKTGKSLTTLKCHDCVVRGVAFSPNDRYLATVSEDCTARLWNSWTGAALQIFSGHHHSINAVVFSPDGRQLATGSSDNTVRLWDVESGLQASKGHYRWINCMIYSPDEKLLASASDDGTIRLWDAKTGEENCTLKHKKPIQSIAFSPDSKYLISASDDGTVQHWDTKNGQRQRTLGKYPHSVHHVKYTPNGKYVVWALRNGKLILYDTQKQLKHALQENVNGKDNTDGHTDLITVTALIVSSNSMKLASASSDHTVKLWSVETAEGHTLPGCEGTSNDLAFSPDNGWLASASKRGTITVWNIAADSMPRTIQRAGKAVNAVTFLRDCRHLVSASQDNVVRVWDLATDTILKTIDTGVAIRTLQFKDSLLETDRGVLSLDDQDSTQAISRWFVKEQWLTKNLEDFLWLPAQYRITCAAVRANRIFLGHPSGKISFLEFNFSAKGSERIVCR